MARYRDRTGDNAAAVAAGLARTGRIITWAAILLVIVIGGFSTGGLTFVKMIGVGMIVAILVDATVVRALLVPAFMKVMGRANWWAPGVLGRFYQRYGVREDESEGPVKAKRIHEPVAEIADQPAPTLPRPRRPQEATTSTRT